jgi:hypothetical protein
MMLDQETFYSPDIEQRPHWISFPFTSQFALSSIATINALAEAYSEDSGDTISEYVETLGIGKSDQRLVKAAIRRNRRALCR